MFLLPSFIFTIEEQPELLKTFCLTLTKTMIFLFPVTSYFKTGIASFTHAREKNMFYRCRENGRESDFLIYRKKLVDATQIIAGCPGHDR